MTEAQKKYYEGRENTLEYFIDVTLYGSKNAYAIYLQINDNCKKCIAYGSRKELHDFLTLDVLDTRVVLYDEFWKTITVEF